MTINFNSASQAASTERFFPSSHGDSFRFVREHRKVVLVSVRRLPEGVYLGTSRDIPGMVVESEDLDELKSEFFDLAPLLLELNCGEKVSSIKAIFELK